jgi:hypothetical protein
MCPLCLSPAARSIALLAAARGKDDLGSFAAHAQHPVTMLFAQVGNIRVGGLEDLRLTARWRQVACCAGCPGRTGRMKVRS